MSHRPTQRPAVSLTTLGEKKALGEPVVMVTAYDYPSAQVAEQAGVDVVLVGDSGAMTVLGHPSTVPVTTEELLMLAQAVRRGLTTPLMIGDMPFGSYEASNEEAIRNAQRFIKEAGCDAVKIERGGTSVERARALVGAGIPVIGIGAGGATDGQVLVFHDLLGIYDGHAARFVKRYASVRDEMIRGVTAFADEVRARRYPEHEHGYTMAPDEIARLHELLQEQTGEPFTGGFSL